MIKHIVFWKLADEADGYTKAENLERMKAAVEAMRGSVPGIAELEIGVDFEGSDAAWDVALYSAFETREALDAYQAHPAHEQVKELVARIRTDRAVVDYEA
ncbi:MAG: Dabb family protein [Coriobacteriia bacterium]|nr:Dabb family protein [Actinomycetota bacterium]MDZ4166568.1 Dabb family protein [Coriobacteriia bacterium]